MQGEGKARNTEQVQLAQYQLDLILGFFPRVDTLLAALLGLNLAMLGVAFARASAFENFTTLQALAAVAYLGTAIITFMYLYRGSFPDIDGGYASLIYFREVAKLDPADYVGRYMTQSGDELSDALLRQAWRNSCILSKKFTRLKYAYRWLLASTVPWALALLAFPHARGA